MAAARIAGGGSYVASAPEQVDDCETLLVRLLARAGGGASILAGFDFPIGLPRRYAELTGVSDFLSVLAEFGAGAWSDFYRVASHADEISLRRPFYPDRPGGTRQSHLLGALGLESMDQLRRVCERGGPDRRSAAPLFWTLGGQQVGKAAISGWRDVLGPALRSPASDLAIWPFSGDLFSLFSPGRVVVSETYPGEFYRHLGIAFPSSKPRSRSGKRVQEDRAANADVLLAWASDAGVGIEPGLRKEIRGGFGSSSDGEDRFDAVVGLFGMLNVVLGRRPSGEPTDSGVLAVEGWMLGQTQS